MFFHATYSNDLWDVNTDGNTRLSLKSSPNDMYIELQQN